MMVKKTGTILLTVLLGLTLPQGLISVAWGEALTQKIDQAVELARTGNRAAAIAALTALGEKHPENIRIFSDLIILLVRDGEYERATDIIERFPPAQLPNYVLEEAMRAYRDAGRFTEAVQLSREYQRREPDTFDAQAYYVLVTADAGLARRAGQQAKLLTDRWPQKAESWTARGYAYERSGSYLQAIRAYQKSLDLAPGNPEAAKRLVISLEKLGATSLAVQLAKENSELFSDDEKSRIITSDAAKQIAHATLEPTNTLRQLGTNNALQHIDSILDDSTTAPLSQEYRLRVQYDRIIGLRDNKMMQEVITEYEALVQAGMDLPGYVKQAAADAYLFLESPEQAAELYEVLVSSEVNNLDAKIGLFFSLIECERIREAHDLALSWDNETPAWIRPEDARAAEPHPDKTSLTELVTLSLYFADRLQEAQQRLEAMVDIAPNMSSLRTTLGDVYRSRGWIEKAVEQYELALALDPNNLSAARGLTAVAIAQRQYAAAEQSLDSILTIYPKDTYLHRLNDELETVQSWDFNIESGYGESDGTTFGSQSGFVGARLYSPSVFEKFRFYGDYLYQNATFPEGREIYDRFTLGAAYQTSALDLEVELGQTFATVEKENGAAHIVWRPDDYQRIGASVELYSKDTPLRAIKNGVNADRIAAHGGYRFSEAMDWRWRAGYMDFSDGNETYDLHTGLFKRLYNYHRFVLDGDLALYASHATLDDTPYYNPEFSLSIPFTANAQYMVWRRYQRSFWNSLAFEAGPVYQKDYGTDINWGITYRHRWKLGPGVEIVYGIGYASRVYDGERESSWQITFALY